MTYDAIDYDVEGWSEDQKLWLEAANCAEYQLERAEEFSEPYHYWKNQIDACWARIHKRIPFTESVWDKAKIGEMVWR